MFNEKRKTLGVKGRIGKSTYVVSSDASYHHKCYFRFSVDKMLLLDNSKGSHGRPVNLETI